MTELAPNLFKVTEPNHVTFYIQRRGSTALLIDSGLGLSEKEFTDLLAGLGITSFDVINTHLHCDHIGMNYLAGKVYVHKTEWEKYVRLADHTQIHEYYKLLGPFKEWPGSVSHDTRDFSDRVSFIEEGTLETGDFILKASVCPGHTSGHMFFSSDEFKVLFTGDIIYDGMLFANLPDSNFSDYVKSLRKLIEVKSSTGYTLLPSHNSIPLPFEYPEKVLHFFEEIKSGYVPGSAVCENAIFKESLLYLGNNLKIQISGRIK
jgi:glyoxylase-like metal-dependent hydrolase (beta-lactamase superfamily II)